MTAKQILDELKAEEELLSRGWEKAQCGACNGSGQEKTEIGIDPTSTYYYKCESCDGRGWNWKAPITK